MTNRHHSLNYLEFSVLDLERATAFYTQAFGWGFNSYGPGYAGIREVADSEQPEVGGFALADVIQQGGPLVILYSDDLETSEAAVTQAGGEIVVPAYDFPGGRRFHFADTEGNVLAVWSEGDVAEHG